MKEYYVEKTPLKLIENGMEFFLNDIEAGAIGASAHIHEAVEILFVEYGTFSFFAGDESFTAQKGDIFLIRSNEIHSTVAHSDEKNGYYVLKFKPSFIFDFAKEGLAISYALKFIIKSEGSVSLWRSDEKSTKNIYSKFLKLKNTYNEALPCADMAMKIGAAEVILAFLRELIAHDTALSGSLPYSFESTTPAQIYKAIKYVNRHYSEQINAKECALDSGMSYSYFSRSFKRITGKTFKEYLNEVRIKHAESLLMTTGMSVTEIALECGYNNVSYFIMIYKSMKGKTPFDFRRKAKL